MCRVFRTAKVFVRSPSECRLSWCEGTLASQGAVRVFLCRVSQRVSRYVTFPSLVTPPPPDYSWQAFATSIALMFRCVLDMLWEMTRRGSFFPIVSEQSVYVCGSTRPRTKLCLLSSHAYSTCRRRLAGTGEWRATARNVFGIVVPAFGRGLFMYSRSPEWCLPFASDPMSAGSRSRGQSSPFRCS